MHTWFATRVQLHCRATMRKAAGTSKEPVCLLSAHQERSQVYYSFLKCSLTVGPCSTVPMTDEAGPSTRDGDTVAGGIAIQERLREALGQLLQNNMEAERRCSKETVPAPQVGNQRRVSGRCPIYRAGYSTLTSIVVQKRPSSYWPTKSCYFVRPGGVAEWDGRHMTPCSASKLPTTPLPTDPS